MQNAGRRILIVDDEQAIGRLLGLVFAEEGFEVRVAGDCLEAMMLCQSESFDVLLSDVRMPGMNGHELVRWVVTRHPETRTILMSGFDDIQCQGCGIAAQPCSLLPKPFAPSEAVRLVGRVLESETTPLYSIS
jgi:DNA-binding NtrC family response regulator